MQALKRIVKKRAKVLRDGIEQEIDASFLVPGDIVILEEGARVPVDGRVVFALNLEMNESSLTGESLSQNKKTRLLEVGVPVPDRSNMVYMGTTVVTRRALVLIIRTGMETEFGKIAELYEDELDKEFE